MKTKGSRNKTRKRILNAFGYIEVFEPSHPAAKRNGYIQEHRKIAYDNGLLLNLQDEVHHINGDKTDNRLSNLAVLKHGAHAKLHHVGRTVSTKHPKCRLCDKHTKSKYRLCAKHYRQQWARVNIYHTIGNIHESPELLK